MAYADPGVSVQPTLENRGRLSHPVADRAPRDLLLRKILQLLARRPSAVERTATIGPGDATRATCALAGPNRGHATAVTWRSGDGRSGPASRTVLTLNVL